MPQLRVSDNHRFLVQDDGTPFFYLGDTAWELFHRLDFDEAERYLRDRAAKGFTVIQAVVLAELDGLGTPNPQGHLPLLDNDPTRPNEAYFADVDRIVELAGSLGLMIGMLPTWGDKVNRKWGKGPEVFDPRNARIYGEFLGRRYRDADLIWINGGDRPPETDQHLATFRALAAGLRAGDEGRHLITYHPMGGRSSSAWFHADDWLDFNLLQSGHGRLNTPNYRMIAHDYQLTPTKPCLDGEPCYEDHPIAHKPENGWFDQVDVRQAAYWAVFAGAHGHTYGCHDIWQFYTPERQPISAARTPWQEAIELPGSTQVGYLRRLMLSRPFLTRIPAPSLLLSDAGEGGERLEATRDADGGYAMVYSPLGSSFAVDLSRLSGQRLTAWWFDPRRGDVARHEPLAAGGAHTFAPPSSGHGHDWVLVLDDAARGFGPPGQP